MSSKRIESLGDFVGHEMMVQLFCTACGNKKIIDPRKLWSLCMDRRWSTKVREVQRRLKCTRCGEKRSEIQLGGHYSLHANDEPMQRDGDILKGKWLE